MFCTCEQLQAIELRPPISSSVYKAKGKRRNDGGIMQCEYIIFADQLLLPKIVSITGN